MPNMTSDIRLKHLSLVFANERKHHRTSGILNFLPAIGFLAAPVVPEDVYRGGGWTMYPWEFDAGVRAHEFV